MKIHLRPARSQDVERLVELAGQLGYPVSIPELAGRLPPLLADGDQALLVAEAEGRSGPVIGWIHLAISRSLVDDPLAEIRALIVDGEVRRQGVGRKLVQAAVDWARQKGLGVIRVRSNVARAEAHAFYQAQGFARTKTSHTFLRRLSD